MSTIGEQGTERCIEIARDHGVAFLDAPVLGTKQPAQEGVTEGAAETIALAEGLGLDPSLFEAIDGGTLDLPYLRIKGKAMIERDFEPMFRLDLAAKDARLVADAADRSNLDLPMLRAIAQRMTLGAKEHGDKDMAATYLTCTPRRD